VGKEHNADLRRARVTGDGVVVWPPTRSFVIASPAERPCHRAAESIGIGVIASSQRGHVHKGSASGHASESKRPAITVVADFTGLRRIWPDINDPFAQAGFATMIDS
jgi:hypothetical protein